MYNRNKCICLGVFSVMTTGAISLFLFSTSMYAQNDTARTTAESDDPIVYHLSSADPWRASIAVSDAINLN
jgi:hypothetical protein